MMKDTGNTDKVSRQGAMGDGMGSKVGRCVRHPIWEMEGEVTKNQLTESDQGTEKRKAGDNHEKLGSENRHR